MMIGIIKIVVVVDEYDEGHAMLFSAIIKDTMPDFSRTLSVYSQVRQLMRQPISCYCRAARCDAMQFSLRRYSPKKMSSTVGLP